jgi:NitT/TauT family transport system permease protein
MTDTTAATSAPSAAAIWLQRLLVLAVFLAGWQAASGRLIPSFYVSDPVSIARVLAGWIGDGSLWRHVGSTLATLALGYGVGALLGIAAGFVLGVLPRAEAVVAPFVSAIYGLPKIALLPLRIIIFGIGIASKAALVVSAVFFLLFYATLGGIRDVDRDYVSSLVLMGASGREVVAKVLLPASLPWIYTGLRTSLGYALTTTVVGEALSSNSGIGFLIAHSAVQFDSAGVFAAVVVLLVLSTLITIGLARLESWRRPG